MPRTLYKPVLPVDLTRLLHMYDLLKSGMSERKVAKAIGVSYRSFRNWKAKRPWFRKTIQEGCRFAKAKRNDTGFTFRDFVVNRLPESLKEIWEKIDKCDSKNGVERIDALLADQGVRARQNLFVHAYWTRLFSISAALRLVGINRNTFELWKKDPEFLRLMEEMVQAKKDFFDQHLCMLVAAGDSSATIFANKTFNRDRYPTQVDLSVKGKIQHNVVKIDDLELSLVAKKEILQALRKRKIVDSEVVVSEQLTA